MYRPDVTRAVPGASGARAYLGSLELLQGEGGLGRQDEQLHAEHWRDHALVDL